MSASILIILRERHAKPSVDSTEDDRVGKDLHEVRLTGREGQENAGREENEENDGDNHVGVNHLNFRTKNISYHQHIR